jgi:hypothetical protein
LRKKSWPLLALITIIIVAGGVFLLKKITILHIENMDRLKVIHIRINPEERFSMVYIHSIYMEPVTEEFQAERGVIVLKRVRTKSPAVMEYYGFEDLKEIHSMNQRLGTTLLIRRGMGEGQGLIFRDRKIYLSEIGERGDRIQLRIESVSPGRYLFGRLGSWNDGQVKMGCPILRDSTVAG